MRRRAGNNHKHHFGETPIEQQDGAVQTHMQEMYAEVDDVARFLEKRRTIELVPEGAKEDVDMTPAERKELESVFAQGENPDIFKNCLLIRDFATPLRVGSALSVRRTSGKRSKKSARRAKKARRARQEDEEDDTDDDDYDTDTKDDIKDDKDTDDDDDDKDGKGTVKDDDDDDDDKDDDDDDDDENGGSAKTTSANMQGDDDAPKKAAPPGEVLVIKGGVVDRDEAPDGRMDSAFMKVDMVAWLSSVAGQVSVVPRGLVAKWNSKKKVPIAGYMCAAEEGNTLYTLPTPCLPTVLDDTGVPEMPPKPTGEGNSTETPQNHFDVYVGTERLAFSSRRKAEHFCHRLAREIAEDPGDNEWDTEKLKVLAADQKIDMKLSTFVQLTRKDPPEAWTTGQKKVLVVVMDWAPGDTSKAPLTHQTTTPAHYRDRIFPRVAEAFRTMSYGKFTITYDVVPEVIQYTKPRSRYSSAGWPFPGLYNGATESLAGHAKYGNMYDTKNYDLVFTISPQQAPVGTKGVAWVGAKGAMCNGCEAISENFQVMVAVHELGHNLGLSHAASHSLEYGNPFDWMGNYPDVTGLSYGMGYKLRLHWIEPQFVARIDDTNVGSLNDRYVVTPFDEGPASSGQIFGIQISLQKNTRDIYIAYRKTTGPEAGIYMVLQDKDKPASELIDMGCHSPSQQDARLQEGWTFIDPSSQVVVTVEKIMPTAATIHLYRTPSQDQQSAIRARDKFSDGTYKCPRTCTDSDLLVSNFNGCKSLASQGYCDTGKITMGGNKYAVKTDLCPQACNACQSVMSGSPIIGGGSAGGCDDRNVKISGMSCDVIAAKGHCEATTNIGHVGRDLCPKSCGNCPPKPSFSSSASAGSYADPQPARTHGGGGGAAVQDIPPPQTQPAPSQDEPAAPPAADEPAVTAAPGPPAGAAPPCQDDGSWHDADGHGCSVYKQYIDLGKLTQREACSYGTGQAMSKCARTCGQCHDAAPAAAGADCEDDHEWRDKDGDGCAVYADYVAKGQLTRTFACNYGGGVAAQHCRKTCMTCPGALKDATPAEIADATGICQDKQCVGKWYEETGQCFSCSDWPSRCGEDAMRNDCPKTCGLCGPTVTGAMSDDKEAPTAEEIAKAAADSDCRDSECIESWLDSTGRCFKCEDFAADYCGNDPEFMKSCPKSCKLCTATATAGDMCHDDFKPSSCQEYKAWGWCSEPDVVEHCKATCRGCGGGKGQKSRERRHGYKRQKDDEGADRAPEGAQHEPKTNRTEAAPKSSATRHAGLAAATALGALLLPLLRY